jgi:hypothetical protein
MVKKYATAKRFVEKRRVEDDLFKILTDPDATQDDLLDIQTIYTSLTRADSLAEAQPLLRAARRLMRLRLGLMPGLRQTVRSG